MAEGYNGFGYCGAVQPYDEHSYGHLAGEHRTGSGVDNIHEPTHHVGG